MNKSLSWSTLFIVAFVCYGLSYVIGGVIGSALGFLGLIALVLAIVAGLRKAFGKK